MSLPTQSRLCQNFATLGCVALASLFLTNFSNYHSAILEGSFGPIYYALPALFAVPLLTVRCRPHYQLLKEPLVAWAAIYSVAGLIWLAFSASHLERLDQVLRLHLLAFYFFIASLVLTIHADRGMVWKVVVAVACIGVVNNWIDFLFPSYFVPPGSDYSNPGRAAGLFLNANQAATALVTMALVAIPFMPMRYRGAFTLLIIAGVLPTFSRSGILLAFLVAVLASLLGQIRVRQALAAVVVMPAAIGIAVFNLYLDGIEPVQIDVKNIEERIHFFLSLGEALDESASERRTVAAVAWNLFADRPLVGNGLGSSLAANSGRGTHNMYLLLLAEQGVIGGILYLSFIAMLLHRGLRLRRHATSATARDVGAAFLLMSAYFSFVGLFSHNLLEEVRIWFLLAFLVTASWMHMRQNAQPTRQPSAGVDPT